MKHEPSYDTAGTAKLIKETGDKSTAAICSSMAATIYDMQILDSNIEDDDNNFTRFLLLSRSPIQPPVNISSKTSIVFSMRNTNEPASLFKALSVFALRDLNLTKIESRPVKPDVMRQYISKYRTDVAADSRDEEPTTSVVLSPPKGVTASKFKYMFYMDFLASTALDASRKAIAHLEEIASFVRILGSYPVDGVLLGQVLHDISSPSKQLGISSPPVLASSGGDLKIGIYGFGRFGQFLAKTFGIAMSFLC